MTLPRALTGSKDGILIFAVALLVVVALLGQALNLSYALLQTSGNVARTGFAVDPRTATMRAEIDVPNPDGKLRPGMYGEATLRLGKGSPDAFRVPRTAVLSVRLATSPPTDGVYVYRGGKARWTVVRTGQWGDQEVEILSGLTAEDRVVADPKGLTGDEVPVRAEPPK